MESKVILEVTSADIPGLLDAMNRADIIVTDLSYAGPLSVRFHVFRRELTRVWNIIEARGERWKEIRRLGIYWKIRSIINHWLLLSGMVIILLLTALLPTKILFVQVRGNQSIPARLILEKAADCGIAFGADRGAVRSEQIKNNLLEKIPQLQWAGINTAGCVAVITVQERHTTSLTELKSPANIVAARDGILLEMTADRGTAVAKPGQAVRAGEILISGYTDCGGVIMYSGAAGEVYGRTRHEITARTLETRQVRSTPTCVIYKISLFIGKKRIYFYEDSGNLDTGCVRIYSEYYITLPGGWKFPVKLRVEKEICHEVSEEILNLEEAEALLSSQTSEYLQSQMIAGRILAVNSTVEDYRYQVKYVCREMIGRVIYEEIVAEYGEDH